MSLSCREVKEKFKSEMAKEFIENGLHFEPGRLEQAWKDRISALEGHGMITKQVAKRLRERKWTAKQR